MKSKFQVEWHAEAFADRIGQAMSEAGNSIPSHNRMLNARSGGEITSILVYT